MNQKQIMKKQKLERMHNLVNMIVSRNVKNYNYSLRIDTENYPYDCIVFTTDEHDLIDIAEINEKGKGILKVFLVRINKDGKLQIFIVEV